MQHKSLLNKLADQYETVDFLQGDPAGGRKKKSGDDGFHRLLFELWSKKGFSPTHSAPLRLFTC